MKDPVPSKPATQPGERARLAALRRYRILDTPEDPEFDRIARLAARLLRTPIGLVSLVDEHRQWFKSHFGLELRETARELSFCAHALASDEVMVVRDATKDERFAANALVTGRLDLRFYAGAPLRSKDGFRLGTLSVLDIQARYDLGSDEFTTLEHLAALVMNHLELRLANLLTEEYAAKISQLSHAAATIAGSDSVEAALQVVAEHISSLLRVRRAVAILANGSTIAIAVDADDFAGQQCIARADHHLELAMGAMIRNQKRTMLVKRSDLERIQQIGTPSPSSLEDNVVCALGAPLVRRDGQSFGAVLALEKMEGTFTAEDDALITQLARVVSVQIEGLLLLQRTRSAEARFRRVVDSGMMGIIFWSETGEITEANDAYLSLLGLAHTDLADGRLRWTDITPPEYAELDRRILEEIKRTGICRPFEMDFIRKGGVRIPVLVGAAALEEHAGSAGVAFVLDMTERREAEAKLKENERIARAIVDTALDAFVQMNEQGLVVDWNRQAEIMFGWMRDEATGLALSDLVVPSEYRDSHREGIRRFLTTGKAKILGKRVEMPAQRRDGSEFPSELTVTALRIRGGYLFNGFIRDLTDRIAVETQLRHIQKLEAMGQLTGGIAHDFNNILAVVIGNLDVLSDDASLAADTQRIVSDALDAALRGSDLTSRLLAFARRQPLCPERISLNEMIQSTADLVARVLPPSIAVQLELANDVWPIEADKSQLEGALMNLITNARDALPNGGQIRIRSRNANIRQKTGASPEVTPGEYATIDVSDTGTGMSPDLAERIFEPFFTTKEPGKGTGLGLSMVFGFMKQSGGHIELQSQLGAGTTLSLYFPRAKELGSESQTRVNMPISKREGTILVVEDNTSLRKTVARQLTGVGYQTIEAPEAESAMKVLRSGRRIDLLLTDIVMPGEMDGVDLAEAAIALRPNLRVVLTSGFPEARSRRGETVEVGFPMLKKPYRKADLMRAIEDACRVENSCRRRIGAPIRKK